MLTLVAAVLVKDRAERAYEGACESAEGGGGRRSLDGLSRKDKSDTRVEKDITVDVVIRWYQLCIESGRSASKLPDFVRTKNR